MNLFWFLSPTQQQCQEQEELRLGQLKMDMALVWHLVCSLEPLQRETLQPEQSEEMDEKEKDYLYENTWDSLI